MTKIRQKLTWKAKTLIFLIKQSSNSKKLHENNRIPHKIPREQSKYAPKTVKTIYYEYSNDWLPVSDGSKAKCTCTLSHCYPPARCNEHLVHIHLMWWAKKRWAVKCQNNGNSTYLNKYRCENVSHSDWFWFAMTWLIWPIHMQWYAYKIPFKLTFKSDLIEFIV